MNGPRVIGPNRRVNVPELSLKHLAAGIIEAAGILAVILSFAANLRLRTSCGDTGSRSVVCLQ